MANRNDKKGDEETFELPPLIDGVIRLFEGIGGQRVSFRFAESVGKLPCNFCSVPTVHRLIIDRPNMDVQSVTVCMECRRDIGEAAR